MYKLMIVDDEASTRYGLRDCFDWQEYGIEVAGEAADGLQGLELAERLQPNIVLSDVKMPAMDGIRMAARLREQMPELKIVFISGYDDIDLIKGALKTEAIDYILKPINLDELASVIRRVVKLSNRDSERRKLFQQMNAKLQQSIPLLREKFLIRLLRDTDATSQSLSKQMEFLEMPLPLEGLFCTVAVSIDNHAAVFERISEQEVKLASFAMQNICQELIDIRFRGHIFENSPGEFAIILVLNDAQDQDEIHPFLEEIKEKAEAFFSKLQQLTLTIGVGGTVGCLQDLPYSYAAARDAAGRKLFLGKSRIITADVWEKGDTNTRRLMGKLDHLAGMLKSLDEAAVRLFLEDIFRDMRGLRGLDMPYCRILCLDMLMTVTRLLLDVELSDESLSESETRTRERLSMLETLGDMEEALQLHCMRVVRRLGDVQERKSRQVIEQIKSDIRKGYAEDITIAALAAKVYLTPTYLCLLFKQETGYTVNDYITKVRMERAMELLRDPQMRLFDISFAIGYTEPGYFSKQFKKTTGISPSEFRERLLERH